MVSESFDVIVIGGGHAGCEAAYAATRLGCRVALVTLRSNRIGFMSCNPAIGGIAKGHLVKEVDALGGLMGRITDRTAIQYRRLNTTKGPAVRSSRAQCDKPRYALEMQTFLSQVEEIRIVEGEVAEVLLDPAGTRVLGVRLKDSSRILARSVVITAGTFMRGVMHQGARQEEGGRAGDAASIGLSDQLKSLGIGLARLKTGTPPRLHRRSVDWSRLERQDGDAQPVPFSFYHRPNPFPYLPQIACFLTYTNQKTHELIRNNLHRSAMYSGAIVGAGPRYCPSIEDKVERFAHRDRHQIFLEPEGLDVDEVYVNGVSTSLPEEVQEEFIRSIDGLEKAEFIRFGYAVEYDAIDPRQLKRSLECKDFGGLFFAGQVNGTSGYEEAAGQGWVAGANAALSALGRIPFELSRMDGYLGVMVDDLILRGVDEPYRMFTSRAEYRLLLREDNADLRLSEKAFRAGFLGEEQFQQLMRKQDLVEQTRRRLKSEHVLPGSIGDGRLEEWGLATLKDRASLEVLLRRPEMNWKRIEEIAAFEAESIPPDVAEQVEVQVKYEGYIRRDMDILESVRKSEEQRLPLHFDYARVPGLSNEIKARLSRVRPETLGQASRLPGVTPAALANLVIHIRVQNNESSRV